MLSYNSRLIAALFCFCPLFSALALDVQVVRNCTEYQDGLRVSFLDVGQGSATLITCPDGRTQLLADSGTSNALYSGGEELFQSSFLRAMRGDRKLEFALLTHPDPDHSFGFTHLFSRAERGELSIGAYIDNGADFPGNKRETKLRSRAKALGVPYRNLAEGENGAVSICNNDDTVFELYIPRGAAAKRLHCPESLNDCSIVIRITHQGISFLLLADTTVAWEAFTAKFAGAPLERRAEVIQVGHHASKAAGEPLLDLLRPLTAVISAGEPGRSIVERYGYPRAQTVDRLARFLRLPPAGGTAPMLQLPVCRWRGKCRWSTRLIPGTVLPTSIAGTIDIYAKQSAYCISSEGLSGALAVTP